MFSILVSEKGGDSKRLDFDKLEVTIGRVQGNDIILPKGNVSKRHSRIVLKDGKFIIVDLKSTNGTYVNGRKITSPLVVKNSDKIYIGDFILSIEEAGAAAGAEEPAARRGSGAQANVPPPPPRRPADEPEAEDERDEPPPPAMRAPAHDDEDDSADHEKEPEPEDEPAPPPRRPTASPPAQAIPTVRPQPSPMAPARAPEPRPNPNASARDVPAIAPSRPTASPRATGSAIPAVSSAPPPAAARPRPVTNPPPAATPAPAPRRQAPQATQHESADAGRRGRILDALRSLSQKLTATLGHELHSLSGDALRERAEAVANDLLAELADHSGLPPGIEPDQLLRDAVGEVVGLGPLDELMLDESVTTVTVARPDRIFVDRHGQERTLAPRWISSGEAAHGILDRIATRSGRAAELADARARGGIFEARLDGGFLISAVVGSLSSGAVSFVVRRGRRDSARLSDLAAQNVMSQGMADFLELAVRARRNILVSGTSGSGRSSLIGALARATEGQRIVFVEESGDVDAGDQPWISLSGAGGDARRAFAAALRLKPERVAMSDVRGAEALDVIGALSGGLDGALVGVTATSSRDALRRLVAAARLAHDAPDVAALEAELPMGVHLVVHLVRGGEGETRIADISEVVAGADGPTATAVFSSRGEGANARFAASGHVPVWAEGAPASMFRV